MFCYMLTVVPLTSAKHSTEKYDAFTLKSVVIPPRSL